MSQLSEVQEQSASEEWYVCNKKKKRMTSNLINLVWLVLCFRTKRPTTHYQSVYMNGLIYNEYIKTYDINVVWGLVCLFN